ncbi:arylsulfatase [Desulforhopalus singaporensis]|uniref:Arylsulfatase n=1 Tax=Desulforhopalus singaporensis TaxID=91360 RepID=A0A1H0V7L1_9BACT|nr:arylsulfatase [Desulforhopalus singaporensis]SDP74334.1 arylsulfatase [Desulforhopalus singaporensis]
MLRKIVLLTVAMFFSAAAGWAANPLLEKTVKVADNMEPVFQHPAQIQEAAAKLAKLYGKTGKRPNILVLLVDDMGWGDPGVYGGGIAVGAPTPHIDQLADEGLRLTSTYAQPTCSPTRATLNTGRLPIYHGIYRPPMYGEKGGLSGEITLAQLLSKAGYHTGMVGKWHLGEGNDQQPQNLGYDEFFGFLGVADIYTDWRDPAISPDIANRPELVEAFEQLPFNHNLVRAKKGEELENLEKITVPVLANIDQQFADYTVDFIKRMAKQDEPFFMIHAFSKVHYDNYPADGYAGKSPSGYPYKDGVIEVDDIVGRVVKTLEETGQAENTFVFFTSDNGPEEDTFPDSGHTPFRGAKGTTWEGGVRVPGIAWWPGVIKGGRASDGLFDLADLFTTSLALAGAKDNIPTDRYIDGIDQTSFLLADDGESNRKTVFYWYQDKLCAIRIHNIKYNNYLFVPFEDGRKIAKSNSVIQKVPYVWAHDLTIDPKERFPALNSHTPRLTWPVPLMLQEARRYVGNFKKYPPNKNVVTTIKSE